MAGKKDLERLRRRRRRKQRIIRATVHLFVWLGMAVLYYVGFSVFFDTPFEYQMKHSTDRLRREYEALSARYDSLSTVLGNFRNATATFSASSSSRSRTISTRSTNSGRVRPTKRSWAARRVSSNANCARG